MSDENLMVFLGDHLRIKSDLEQKIKELVAHNANLVLTCRKEQQAHLRLKQKVAGLVRSTRPIQAPGYVLASKARLRGLLPLIKEQV